MRVLYASRDLLAKEKQDKKRFKGNFKHRMKDFDFIKTLGQGGFANVNMVRKKTNGFLYAMKMISKKRII